MADGGGRWRWFHVRIAGENPTRIFESIEKIIFSTAYIDLMYRQFVIALTISPPKRTGVPSFHYRDDLEKLRCIRRCSRRFIIYPEFDLQGRLHYHGTVHIHDKIKWFKSVLPSFEKMGFVKVKLDPNLAWTVYQSKSFGVTSHVLGISLPIYPGNTRARRQSQEVLRELDSSGRLLPQYRSILDWCVSTE